jgi:hypothetical protein
MTQIVRMDADTDRICVHLPNLRHLRSAFARDYMAQDPGC